MADTKEIKELKKKIGSATKELNDAQATRDEWASQLEVVHQLIQRNGPKPETAEMDAEISAMLEDSDAKLETLRQKLADLDAELPKPPEPAAPKFDPEKHPLLRKAVEKPEPEKPVNYNTGDIVEVQWSDKAWYKAKIQMILGSASAPKYHIKFLDYDETTTVDRTGIRPLQHKRKRDPESTAVVQTATSTSSPHVISAPAVVNKPQVVKEPTNSVGKKERTIGSNKALGARVSNWKNFTSKGVGKKATQKESMFRSGTSVNSRVGFTGSGAGMTEVHKRVRYDKKKDEEEEAAEQAAQWATEDAKSPPTRKRY